MMGRNQPLAQRLTMMNLLVSLTVLGIAISAFFSYDVITYRQNVLRGLGTQAQIIGSNSVSSILFDDPSTAAKTRSALNASPYVLNAAIVKREGSVFATYSKDSAHNVISAPELGSSEDERHWNEGRRLYVLRAINFENKRIGAVYLGVRRAADLHAHATLRAASVFAYRWIFGSGYAGRTDVPKISGRPHRRTFRRRTQRLSRPELRRAGAGRRGRTGDRQLDGCVQRHVGADSSQGLGTRVGPQ
ncbi:MAG: hypothetical protein NVS9B15_15590 [Acidobacteriaceae bacterium]